MRQELGEEIRPLIEQVYTKAARKMGSDVPIGVDWNLVNEQAVSWAKSYTFDLVREIDGTTQARLQRAISRYFEEQTTIGQLQKQIVVEPLKDMLGRMIAPKTRAEMIARTEVTRAAAQGEMAVVQQVIDAGLPITMVWATNNDDLVCPICGPRNGKKRGDGWADLPPIHPRCRCWINHEFGDPEDAASASVLGLSSNMTKLADVALARAAGSATWTDAEIELRNLMDEHGLAGEMERTLGLWNNPEPSFVIAAEGPSRNVFAFSRDWRDGYDQQAVAVLTPNKDAAGGILEWDFGGRLSDGDANKLLGELIKLNEGEAKDANLFLGLTVRDNGKVEYWFGSAEQKKVAEQLIDKALEKSGLSPAKSAPQYGYGLSFVERGRGKTY